ALEHDEPDCDMPDRRLGQHEARIMGEEGGAAEDDDEAEARPGHVAQRLTLDARPYHLADGAEDGDWRREDDVVGGKIDDEEDDGGEKVGAEPAEYVFHRRFLLSSVKCRFVAG